MSGIRSINTSTLTLFNKGGSVFSSKAAKEKTERQQKMNSQIDYFEEKKAGLKNKKCGSLEAIKDRLELLQSYEDEITAAKMAYNKEQMFHALDEARERAEKIAKEAEKYAPKTAEERREEMVEEARGTEENKGELTEALEELTDVVEEMTEEIVESEQDVLENLESKTENMDASERLSEELAEKAKGENAALRYKRIDMRI